MGMHFDLIRVNDLGKRILIEKKDEAGLDLYMRQARFNPNMMIYPGYRHNVSGFVPFDDGSYFKRPSEFLFTFKFRKVTETYDETVQVWLDFWDMEGSANAMYHGFDFDGSQETSVWAMKQLETTISLYLSGKNFFTVGCAIEAVVDGKEIVLPNYTPVSDKDWDKVGAAVREISENIKKAIG